MQIRREGMEEVKSSLADVVSKPDRTFKELSGSEKVRFILDYYKWHILAGVVVLGVIISMINHYAFHNQATQLYGLGVNLSAESDVCEAFKAEYEEYAGIDKRHYTNVFEYNLFMGANDPASASNDYATVMKLVTLIAAREVDYMFCDQIVFEEYARNGGFADLSELLPAELYQPLLDQGLITEGSYVEEESGVTHTYPMAIDITDLAFTKSHGFTPAHGDKLYMVIVSNSKRQAEAINMVRMVLGKEYVPAVTEE